MSFRPFAPFDPFRRPADAVGGGSPFPQIVGTAATYTETSLLTSHPVTLPSGIVSGELLLMIIRQGGSNVTKTPPSGWTAVLSGSFMEVYNRTADGLEGATADVELSTARKLLAVTMRISPAAAVEASTFNSLNSPSLSPAWGSDDTLWIAGSSVQQNDSTFAYLGDPTSYTRVAYLETTDGAGASDRTDAQLVIAYRTLATATEDPDAWPTSGTQSGNRSQTIAIRP
jgi:hypothetical protein